MNNTLIQSVYNTFQESFYILDTKQFEQNYIELLESFRRRYKNTNIAYSYKTNYIPRLCSIVNALGGFAEIVSEMEWQVAKLVGVEPKRVIFNGPCKHKEAMKDLLLAGGTVNLDSYRDFKIIKEIIASAPGKKLSIGIRLNFNVGETDVSRFGFDAKGAEITEVLSYLENNPSVYFNGVHAHFASRSLPIWKNKVAEMFHFLDKIPLKPRSIDFGGGLYGKMPQSLKEQFVDDIPNYDDYADIIASEMQKRYGLCANDEQPLLLIEPGSALAGDVMRFVCKVDSIKNVRGKWIATVLGSIYNINPTLNKKNPPIEVIKNSEQRSQYRAIDIAGFTCIESDYMYRGYQGELGIGDYVIFSNVGSYSIVLKPPFILPNFAVLEIQDGKVIEIKRKETFADVFNGYKF